jgi:hypothetical protein
MPEGKMMQEVAETIYAKLFFKQVGSLRAYAFQVLNRGGQYGSQGCDKFLLANLTLKIRMGKLRGNNHNGKITVCVLFPLSHPGSKAILHVRILLPARAENIL